MVRDYVAKQEKTNENLHCDTSFSRRLSYQILEELLGMEIDFSDLPYQKYHEYLRAPLKHFSGSDKIKCKDDDVCIPVIN